MTKRDYIFGILAGFLIGVLAMPVLKISKPDLYDKISLVLIPFFLIATPVGLLIFNAIGKKIAVVWQIGKFGVIGVLNTLVDWGVLAFLIGFFKKYLLVESTYFLIGTLTFYSFYKAISFVVANVNSYAWNKYWTFSGSIVKKTREEFLQFFMVSLVGFVINVSIASYIFKAITPMAGLNTNQWAIIGAAVASISGLVWNFIGYKFIVFKAKN